MTPEKLEALAEWLSTGKEVEGQTLGDLARGLRRLAAKMREPAWEYEIVAVHAGTYRGENEPFWDTSPADDSDRWFRNTGRKRPVLYLDILENTTDE